MPGGSWRARRRAAHAGVACTPSRLNGGRGLGPSIIQPIKTFRCSESRRRLLVTNIRPGAPPRVPQHAREHRGTAPARARCSRVPSCRRAAPWAGVRGPALARAGIIVRGPRGSVGFGSEVFLQRSASLATIFRTGFQGASPHARFPPLGRCSSRGRCRAGAGGLGPGRAGPPPLTGRRGAWFGGAWPRDAARLSTVIAAEAGGCPKHRKPKVTK